MLILLKITIEMNKSLKRILSMCAMHSLFSLMFIPPCPAQIPRESTLSESLSLQDVNAFAQDSLGYMWIATLGGLNRFNGYEFQQFLHDAARPESLPDDFVFSLFIDSARHLWVGTASGVCRYDFDSETFIKYPGTPADAATYGFFEDRSGQIWTATPLGPGVIDEAGITVSMSGPEKSVKQLWEDASGHLWMGLDDRQGLAVKKHGASWEYVSVPGARHVTCMYSDPRGIWWLGTNNGIILFNPDTFSFSFPTFPVSGRDGMDKSHITFIKEIEPLKIMIGTETEGFYLYDMMTKRLSHNAPSRFNPRNSAQLHTCYLDRQKNVWVGTYDKGVAIGNKQSDYFNPDKKVSDEIEDKFVTRVVEDLRQNLWIGTRYNGLFRYSRDGGFDRFSPSDLLPDGNEFLEVVFIDSRNRVWVAFQSQMIIATVTPSGDIHFEKRIDINNVRVIKEDSDHDFWIGTWKGLFKMTADYDIEMIDSTSAFNVTDILLTDAGSLLFSAYGNGIYAMKKGDASPTSVNFPDEELQVSRTAITLFKDSRERLWLGSYGNGLLCRSSGQHVRLSVADGLPSNNILCFQEDFNGNIWCSTSHGISKLRPAAEGYSVTNYFSANVLPGNQFHEKSGCRTADGSIFFGGNHGLTFFNPSDFVSSSAPPLIHIEDLKIFNRSVRPAAEGSVLSKSILFTDAIVLNHRQRMISLDYAGIDFFTSNNLTYKYRLEGFDSRWNYVGTHRRASYSNLPPGKYRFEVSAINAEGVESAVPAMLGITVKPAPWFTWEAWTGYSILLSILVFFLLRTFLNAKLNKQRAEMEHNEKEREKEIAKMKITFFTNISHELRTPLALISAPLEKLMKDGCVSESGKKYMIVADRNAHRMHQLINQLMDSVKIENGVLSLHVNEIDIIALLSGIHESFLYVAEQKSIRLEFRPHTSRLMLWADADKVEKILYNLLSNAIKHTPADGKVTIGSSCREGYLEISVSDTGEGIPADKLDDLFVRYRIVNGSPDYSGNGIGLHYTKTLVEKHKGTITAQAGPGGGMVFTFTLPLADVYEEKDKDADTPASTAILTDVPTFPFEHERAAEGDKKYRILVAEDNVELREFITDLLSDTYGVVGAPDGQAALERMERTSVDLVLSDVIMPGLSGYELCAEVKQNPELCHIPIVLLTARTSMDDQLKGLETGADAYICKPFNIDYLKLTIRNLLHRKELLKQYFTTPESEIAGPVQESLNTRDRDFLDKLMKLMAEELSNPDLNVDYMAQCMGYSRTILYRKIKGLTDLSPNDFMRNYRFKRAAELILQNTLPLVEISEQTGFSSYSYFSKAFKQHFGLTPKEYQSKQNTPHGTP